jgi:hypothetical protein
VQNENRKQQKKYQPTANFNRMNKYSPNILMPRRRITNRKNNYQWNRTINHYLKILG